MLRSMSEFEINPVRVSVELPRFVVDAIDEARAKSTLSRAEMIREALRCFEPVTGRIAPPEVICDDQ